jgi:hypothetical protein
MPPTLMSVVINRSEAASASSGTSRPQPSPKLKPRTYDDKPLPIRVSDHAPRNATIKKRDFESGVVTFELKIGETTLEDVGLDEVLDYVSAYHLEEFENKEFREQEEVLKTAAADDRRLKEEQDERRRERARTKGTVLKQEISDGEEDDMELDVDTGRNGRARPSYKPLFRQFKQRGRRRKRDPETGELIPRSDDDMEGEQESSSDVRHQKLPRLESKAESLSLDNLPKRRRRKRHPITGELLPLDPINPVDPIEPTQTRRVPSRSATVDLPAQQFAPDFVDKQKRPRRRRHPITNELMPLGWRYDPEEEQSQKKKGIKVPSMQRLSISNENEPKRRRLDQGISNERPSLSDLAAEARKRKGATAPLSAFKRGDVIDLLDSDSSDSADDSIDVRPNVPKPKLLRRGFGGASVVQKMAKSQSQSESPGPSSLSRLPVRTSSRKSDATLMRSASSNSSIIPLQVDGSESSSAEELGEEVAEEGNDKSLPPVKPMTSIMHPSENAKDSSSSEEESEDQELPDNECFVEDILRHALSNPQTHPDSLGKQPVMLYEVKWAGHPETTWEPETSFGSLDVVREYQRRVGMKV